MADIKKIVDFLDKAQTYYLATNEGDQPRVRPFGTVLIDDGKIYIQTGRSKNVSKQIAENPKAEICAFTDGVWLRIACELVDDDKREIKVAMLEKYPALKSMYDPDDGNTQVLYMKNGEAVFSSFTGIIETINF